VVLVEEDTLLLVGRTVLVVVLVGEGVLVVVLVEEDTLLLVGRKVLVDGLVGDGVLVVVLVEEDTLLLVGKGEVADKRFLHFSKFTSVVLSRESIFGTLLIFCIIL
jgi:hypothetical protein